MTDKMKVEMKNYKRIRGHDGQGFNSSIYINGTRVGTVDDDGRGGGLNPCIDPKHKELFNEFTVLCKQLPPMPSEYFEDGLEMDWELFYGELVDKAEIKNLTRGKQIVIIDGGETYTMGRKGQYNEVQHAKIEKQIQSKYPNAKLANGMRVEAYC